MTKGRIINAIFVLSVIGVALSVYIFYFKEKLATYATDRELGVKMDSALKSLETDFSGRKPEWLTTQWRANIPTWTTTVNRRAGYFSYGDWSADIPKPEEERTIKFWYDEVMRKMLTDFYRDKVNRKYPNQPTLFPAVNQFLGEARVQTLDQWTNQDVDIKRVNSQLTNLTFAMAAANLLMDHNATSIRTLLSNPPVVVQAFGEITQTRTIDTVFTMTAKDLVQLIEDVRTTDRYFTVDGIKIEYPYIGYEVEPQLQVAMLLTQSAFNPQKLKEATAAVSSDNSLASAYQNVVGPRGPRGRPRPAAGAPPGMFARAWKWFKRFYFATN